MIETTRLKLIPASLAHVRAEINDHTQFAQLLAANVPSNWPPESAADALPLFLAWLEAAPDQAGWFAWYALLLEPGEATPTLVGGGGFLGPPTHGEVQIGYSMLPQFQQRGIATEMVAGLVGWALSHPEVICIVGETEWENPASVQVLKKIGFAPLGATNTLGGMRFELRRTADYSMSR
ncbi:MAG: [ribosomal protein S5]-alanine N-acetyltransferase [Gammaproteobacteria bacterium]|jgi:ribosomal-protein-alanine N-acetyltransferase|nr:[ribosomal protein S5]-alanine N-acetyltransferase [Gammaproteobacteria bacterium]